MWGRSPRTTAPTSAPAPPLDDLARFLPGAGAALAVAGLGLADGGSSPLSWGWAGVGLAGVAVAALAVRVRVRLSRLELGFLAALLVLTLWSALSAEWSLSPPSSVLEAQRLLVYVGAGAAFLLAGRRASVESLLAGAVAGTVVVGAANLLLRDPSSVDRGDLARPVESVNGLAILLALGIAVALGLALTTRGRGRVLALAAAAFLLVPFALLESRGAWVALGVGLAAAAILRLARSPLAFPLAVAVGLVVTVAAGVRFDEQRAAYWRVGAEQVRSAPVAGTGAGTYGRVWLRERREPVQARDAHNVYLETLGDVGPVGLALLAAALAVPIAAAVVARHDLLAVGPAAAYAAFLVHAGIEWDWDLAAVTVAALASGAALLLLARPRAPAAVVGPRLRLALVVGAVVVCLAALGGLVGNSVVSRAEDEAAAGAWPEAEDWARRATVVAPWSADAWRLRGEAELARGDRDAARVSLTRAVGKDPSDARLWLALANSLRGNARASAVAEALRLNPLGIAEE